jgi:hypothetical protein
MSRGAALPAVLFTLSISTALAVGGLYVTRQLARSTAAHQRGAVVHDLVEGALALAVAQWDTSAWAARSIGSTIEQSSTLSLRESGVLVWTTRVGEYEYWLVAEATSGHKPLLHRRLGLYLSLRSGRPEPVAPRAWAELPE